MTKLDKTRGEKGTNGEVSRLPREQSWTQPPQGSTMIKKNPFIVIEGIDASGKETISRMLAEYFIVAKLYSFPNYSTPTGKLIREHLQRKWTVRDGLSPFPKEDALVFQALQAANRLEVAQSIQAYLQAGYAVVADRYTVSGEVYGAADGLDPAYLQRLFAFLPKPDITFLLDISVEESFRRRPDRGGDRYEQDKAKLEDIRQRYLQLFQSRAHDNPWSWKVIGGTQSPEDIVTLMLRELGR